MLSSAGLGWGDAGKMMLFFVALPSFYMQLFSGVFFLCVAEVPQVDLEVPQVDLSWSCFCLWIAISLLIIVRGQMLRSTTVPSW